MVNRGRVGLGNTVKILLPFLFMLFLIVLHDSIPNEGNYQSFYYPIFLRISLGIYAVLLVLSIFLKKVREKLVYLCWLILVAYAIIGIIDFGTLKSNIFNDRYIPSIDLIISSTIENSERILTNFASSAVLWFVGILFGVICGLSYGILMGWSKIGYYWLFPFIEVIGPIPGSIWMVIAVVIMPTSKMAGVFLIALAVWFPLAFNLGSAIRGLSSTRIEKARILGTTNAGILWRVALPSAVPAIFSGLFMGICFSFSSLISAELLGVSQGIGWLVNYYSQWSAFDLVYGCMVLIVAVIYLVIECLFQIQDRVLKWQEGILRW